MKAIRGALQAFFLIAAVPFWLVSLVLSIVGVGVDGLVEGFARVADWMEETAAMCDPFGDK